MMPYQGFQMDNIQAQNTDTRTYDYKGIYSRFAKADSTIESIRAIYERRMHDTEGKATAMAYPMAFIHPELKGIAKSSRPNVRSKVADSLLDTYSLDTPPKSLDAHPLIRLIEDIRSGTLMTSLEGQRMGAGEDPGSSAVATNLFSKDADRLAKEVESDDKFTTMGCVKNMIARAKSKMDKAVMVRDTINPGVLFGYTMETVPGKDEIERTENWKHLERLEHWFYYAFRMSDNSSEFDDSADNDAQPASWGSDVYLFASIYKKFLEENPDVTELARDIAKFYSADAIEGQVEDIPPETLAQVSALLAVRPGIMKPAIEEMDRDASPDKASADKAAAAKVAAVRRQISGVAANKTGFDKLSVSTVAKAIAGYQHDNEAAADLCNIIKTAIVGNKNRYTKPVANMLNRLVKSPKSESTLFNLACLIGKLLNSPKLMDGLIPDPENPPKVPDLTKQSGTTDTTEVADDNEVADVGKPSEDADGSTTLKDNAPSKTPYDKSLKYLGRSDDDMFVDLGKEDGLPVRELSPDSDVRGAIILPELAIPLFAQKVSYPGSIEAADKVIYSIGVTLVTYLALYLPADLPKPEWLDAAVDDKNTVSGLIIDTPQVLDVNDINPVIEEYLGSLVTGRPANAIIARNKWVDALSDKNSWNLIYDAVFGYLNNTVADTEETRKRLPAILGDIRKYVLRNIFDVKSGCVDYTMPDQQVAEMVKPYDPVNRSSNGRLRKSGGIDGSVTNYGLYIIKYTKGRVAAVSGSGENRMFKLTFENKAFPADVVSIKNADTWIPDRLIEFMDPDTGTLQYAVWVGLQFCSEMSDEGSVSTARIPKDIIDVSNDTYLNTVGYTGAVGVNKSADEVIKKLGVPTSDVIQAVGGLADKLTDSQKSEYNSMFEKLGIALKSCTPEAATEIVNMLQVKNLAGKQASDIATQISSKLVNGICATGGTEVDSDAFDSMTKIMSYCGEKEADKRIRLIRLLSAFNALLSAAPSGDGSIVGAHPFTCQLGDDRVVLTVTDDLTDFSAMRVDFSSFCDNMEELKDSLSTIIENIQYTNDESIDEILNLAEDELNSLRKEYAGIMMEGTSIRSKKVLDAFDGVIDSGFVNALTGAIENVIPAVKGVPELSNLGIETIYSGIADAAKLSDTLKASKSDVRTVADYNQAYGNGLPSRIHGEEADDIPGMEIDVNGENDVIEQAKMSSSLTTDMEDFDAEANSNYSTATNYPMLGMIKCDPEGMGSGQDNFDIEQGINPGEFEEVARLLDESQLYAESMEGARGKNIPIRQYEMYSSGAISTFIYKSFYRFMADGRRIGDTENNILDKAHEVVGAAKSNAAACRDDSIRDELIECAEAFEDLVSNVANAIPEQYTSIADANRAVATCVSTAIANIVLYLGSISADAAIANGGEGLEQYGSPEAGRLGIGNAGLYASVHSQKKKLDNTRMLAKGVETPNKIFLDKVKGGMNGAPRFVSTMANFYTALGMDSTAGFEGALNPFEDIAQKLNTKAGMGFRNLYFGEAQTTLGAILVWAITQDESRNDDSYSQVNRVVQTLMHQKNPEAPARLEIPAFLVEGLKVNENPNGRSLNLTDMVDVYITDEGKAVYAQENDLPDEVFEKISTFNSIHDVWEATKLTDISEQFTVDEDSTPEDLARAVRVAVINTKLQHSNALNSLPAVKDNTGKKKYEPAVQRTIDTVKSAAASTKSMGDMFVPFSVVYASIDETYLNTAMSQMTDAAHDALIRKANDTINRDIFRRIYGNDDSDNLSGTMEAHRNDIVYALAKALGHVVDGKLDYETRDEILNSQRPVSEDNLDETVPDSSLNVILGNGAAKFLDTFISSCGKMVSEDTDPTELTEIAESYVNRIFQPANDLKRISRTLFDIVDGNVSYEDGIAEIVKALGDKTTGIADDLVNAYLRMLGTPDDMEAAKLVSETKRRNVANNLVRMVMQSNSEFRNIYRASHGSDIGDVRQARLVMHGKSPIPNVEKVDGIGGVNKLYSKTAAALSGEMPEDEAAEYLSDVKFSFAGVTGEDALTAFNGLVGRIGRCIKTLMNSTRKGIVGSINQDPDNAKAKKEAADNHMGSSPMDQKTAGVVRGKILFELENLVDEAKEILGLNRPESEPKNPEVAQLNASLWTNNDITRAITDIVSTYCSWNPNADQSVLARKANLLGDKDVSRTVMDTIRTKLANAYARGRLYQKGVENIVNNASMFRGVSSDTRVGIDRAREILGVLAGEPDSPVMMNDSDVTDEYLINGAPASLDKCVGIIADAIDMYNKTHPNDRFTDADADDPEFIECVRRNLSVQKDYGLSTGAIVEIFLRNMISNRYLGKSSMMPYGVTKYYNCKPHDDTMDKGEGERCRLRFDIPLDTIRDIVNDAMRNTEFTSSANQWAQFSEDFAKYTAAGNRSRGDGILTDSLKDDMVRLFKKVSASLNTKLASVASKAEFRDLHAGRRFEDDSGIIVTLPGAAAMPDNNGADLREGDNIDQVSLNP